MFLRTFGRATLILALFSTAAFAQNTGTVIGTVRASDGGDAIAGVAVRVVGASQAAMTRGDGTFRLQLPAGQHNIQASLIGFAASTATVNVVAGQTVTQNFTLTQSALPLNEVVAVGTRVPNRTVTESPVPVDVIPEAVIQNVGVIETSQILQRLAPSVNFPRTAITDGTDHLRPVTLRGLAP
ncbi:MAG TPA: carboxypeptidase-like regulatory domain-containing protein, partial [Longimicrobiales bacterium]